MAEHVWTILCEQATVDEKTNNLSLLRIIEQIEVAISSPELPPTPFVIPVDWTIGSFWARTKWDQPEKVRARLQTLSPTGTRLGVGEFDVDLTVHRRMRTLSKIAQFAIDKGGLYTFSLDVATDLQHTKWTQVGKSLLEVVVKHRGAVLI